MPISAATWATGRPAAMRWHRIILPAGGSRELAWATRTSSGWAVRQLHHAGWFASDFVTPIERWISQHLLGLLARVGGADHARPPAWDRPDRPTRQAVLVPVAE